MSGIDFRGLVALANSRHSPPKVAGPASRLRIQYSPESDVRCAQPPALPDARLGPVAHAVVGRAKVRAALHHRHITFIGLCGIETAGMLAHVAGIVALEIHAG